MNVLDTDMFTLFCYGKYPVVPRVIAARDAGLVAVPGIVRAQVLIGRMDALLKAATASDVLRMQQRLAASEAALGGFPILPFDAAAGGHFDRLRQDRKLKKLGLADLLIACVALAHNATVQTRNTKDFVLVPNLRVADWSILM